jgi:hypothetical protein
MDCLKKLKRWRWDRAVGEREGGHLKLFASGVYDLTLLSLCVLFVYSDLPIPFSEQAFMLLVGVIAVVASSIWVKLKGASKSSLELSDAISRWLCALASAYIYFQARWVLLPEAIVPKHNGIPWQIPWASIIIILRAIAFACAFPEAFHALSVGARETTGEGKVSATALQSVERYIRLSLLLSCVLICAFASCMFVIILEARYPDDMEARYPADMFIGYTVSVVSKACEITAFLLMSSYSPSALVRRDIAMWVLVLTIICRALVRAIL